jgi:hypothetical protein
MQAIRQVSDRHWFIAPLAMVVAIALFPFMRSLFDRSEPIRFVSAEVVPNPVTVGGEIQVIRGAYVSHACGGTTYRNITDAKGYVHALAPTPTLSSQFIPDAEHRQMLAGRILDLSDAMAPGPAKLGTYIEYACPWLWFDRNPVQQVWPVKVRLPDLPFEVRR